MASARAEHLGADREANALHELALVKRDLCKLDEADDLFQQALEAREPVPSSPPRMRNLTRTIFELAQLRYERGRYAEAIALMERGLPLVEQMRAEERQPAILARVLDEYADALTRVNRTADAEVVRTRVRTLVAARGLDLTRVVDPPFDHPPCR